jgi:hypothetical protein
MPGDIRHMYRPSAIVRLSIRLEEFKIDNPPPGGLLTEETPFEQQLKQLRKLETFQTAELASARVQASQSKGPTLAVSQLETELGKTRSQIAAAESQGPPARGYDESKGDIYSVSILTVPTQFSCDLNTYRSVDTLKVTIPFKDAPFESQNIRSCLVEVYLGTVTSEDFINANRWILKLDGRKNIVFRGYVDDWGTSHDDTDSTVELSARSLECILFDSKLDPRGKTFKLKKEGEKISAYVNRILAECPATSGRLGGDQLKAIFYNADPQEEPSLDKTTMNRVLQVSKSRNENMGTPPGEVGVLADDGADTTSGGDTEPGGIPQQGVTRMPPADAKEMSAWDLIVQACSTVGLVPVYDPSLIAPSPPGLENNPLRGIEVQSLNLEAGQGPGQTESDFLLLRPPHTIYGTVDQGFKINPPQPPPEGFLRELPNTNSTGNATIQSEVRFMVWGRNIKSIKTSRKLGRVKVPTLEILGYNPDATPKERNIVVRYPPEDTKRATHRQAKGGGASEEVVRRFVNGIRSKEQLQQIAVALYHAIGRNELVVTIETDDMASFMGPNNPKQPNDDPDILKIRHGTPIRLVVANQVRGSKFEDITLSPLSEVFERRTTELRQFFLDQKQRFSPSLSPATQVAQVEEMVRRISDSIRAARRTDLFYVRQVTHNFSADDGWSANIELINFLEARNIPANFNSDLAKKIDNKRRVKTGKAKPSPNQKVLRSQGK